MGAGEHKQTPRRDTGAPLRRRTAGEEDGKELLKMHGYDCYDYGARHSYTALGRFTTIDPLAEIDYETSPYALCKGNPVRYIDPDGEWSVELNINLSVGVQSSGSIGFAGVTFNLFSATLMDVNVKYDSETENHFSFDASMISGPDGKTEISQEASVSVPFIKVGAKHSFETTGSSSVNGTDKIEPILPVNTENDDITLKASYGGSVIVGGEANLSVTF